ncbi:MAG: winged helix-turn-helix domain-containing protein, partial [Burkholderiales bacterium]
MHPKTIFAKTPKGVLEVKNKTTKLARDVGVVFLSVDGKSTVSDLAKKSGMDEKALTAALQKLTNDGFVKVFSSPDMASGGAPTAATAASIAQAARAPAGGSDDLDFTSPEAMAK